MEYLQKQSSGGVLYIICACFFWGTSGTAFTFFNPEGSQPAIIGILRLTVTAIALIAVIMLQKKSDQQRPWKLSTVAAAGAMVAANQFCFFNAIDLAGVALGTTFFIGSYPIFAGILGFLILKERPSLRWRIATGVSIAGGTLMTLGSVAVDGDPVGIFFALGAAASFAYYAILIKGLLNDHSAVSITAVSSAVGIVFLSPLLFVYDISWIARDFKLVLPLATYLGVVTYAIPLLLFSRGIKLVPVATAATLTLVEPMTATLCGVVILHEYLAVQSWVGMGLLLIGVLWLSLPVSFIRKSNRCYNP
jgi:drug/metabolite transporter, DME family